MTDANKLGYLAHLILQIITGTKPAQATREYDGRTWHTYSLGGGAQLWWHADRRQLMALRANVRLEPREPEVFAAHIRKAGYSHGRVADVVVGGDLNTWHGVTWKVSDGVVEVVAPAQGRLL